MNIVISDPNTRKAYPKKIDNPAFFIGKKIGDEVELGVIGLDGYKARITGGSDKQGFPMKRDLEGTSRIKVFVTVDSKKGIKKKVSRRGNQISEEIAQINLKVVKYGGKSLEELLGGEKTESKEEKVSIKEQMVKESLENVGKISAAEAKDIKKFK